MGSEFIAKPQPYTPDPSRGRCRDCGYSLCGLTEQRCPECGRPFDPNDPATMDFGLPGPVRLAVRRTWQIFEPIFSFPLSIGFCWFTYIYRHGQWSLFFFLPAIYLASRRRWISLTAFLLLTPLSMAFLRDASQYVDGSPMYVNGKDEIWHPQGSINPTTRIRGHNPGCGTRSGNSWIGSLGETWAGAVMYRLIGPPRGAYTGPYPTKAEVTTALASGTKFNIPNDWTGQISLPTGVVVVNPEWFIFHFQPRRNSTAAPPPATLIPSAVLWKRRCLIVKIPRDVDNGPWADVFLIDIQKSQLFAMYAPL